jgi:signal transduction histidine kinase
MLVAVLVFAIAGVGSLLPTMQQSALSLIPSALMIVAPSLITYAIIKHQLWNIRTVIHKTALWAAASLVLIVPLYLVLWLGWPYMERYGELLALAVALLIFCAFALHFRVIQPWLDHLFARGRHDPAKVVDAFNHDVVNLRGVQDLSLLLRDTIRNTVYATAAKIAAADVEEGVLREEEDGSPVDLPAAVRRWLVLNEQVVDISLLEFLRLPEEDERNEVARYFRGRNTSIVLPLVDKLELIGLVEVGDKQNLRAYTREDFILLEQVRAPATVALANARLYDRLQNLTASLEKRVEQRTAELRQANEKLQLLDRQKNKFFANITHELRTPLTMILAPLEDMQLLTERSELSSDLRAMHRNSLRLLRQINGLLDLAKLDAGELRLKVTDVALDELAGAAVKNFEPIGRRRKVGVYYTGPDPETDAMVVADPDKLDLVLGNLLANAIKFTPEGGRVDVKVTADGEWLVLSVKDNGIGIPEDQLERVFDRFAQVESGPTRRFEGAGIGLSLVKEMVALHGGEIEVASREGQGSEFRIRLHREGAGIPRHLLDRREVDVPTGLTRRAEDRDPVGWVPFDLEGDAWVSVDKGSSEHGKVVEPESPARVMIVEDNADMRAYLQRRLARKYALEVCKNGKDALERIAERPPDLVLSDVMMPELSGYELCRAIKDKPETASVPVILVTARKGADRTLEGYRAGADDYLTKPFNIHELLARIEVQLRLQDLARQLARREKGEVMNLVAAGLAHEVRNPVNAILNAVRPLVDPGFDPPTPEARRELLEAVLESAERIDRLCEDLLGVSRPHLDEHADWDVGEALESAVRLIRHKRRTGVTVEHRLHHGAPVFGRTSQLNQVLLNLLDNAVRAAGEAGQVQVITEQRNGTFRLRVQDSGPGLPPGKEERIFDPLFSTHARDGSTGLGLHICRRIVEEHQGSISAHNLPRGGAELKVELPLAGGLTEGG